MHKTLSIDDQCRAAQAAYVAAFAAYAASRENYRLRIIGDAEFLSARKAVDAAMEKLDAVEATRGNKR